MKDLLRKGLDAYESRREQSDDEFAALVSSHVAAMDNKAALRRYIAVLGTLNTVAWASVAVFPADVAREWG